MFVISNFLVALARIISILTTLYIWIVIIRALISWVIPDPYNPIIRFLRNVTDPVLIKLRRFIPSFGGIDISPLILIIILYVLKEFLVSTLLDWAREVR